MKISQMHGKVISETEYRASGKVVSISGFFPSRLPEKQERVDSMLNGGYSFPHPALNSEKPVFEDDQKPHPVNLFRSCCRLILPEHREVSVSRQRRKMTARSALLRESLERTVEITALEGLIQGINSLFPCLYDLDDLVRWRAVSVLGVLVDRLARKNLEAARVIVRRLMWNLNDESGGIGWGSAETIAEILSLNERFAGEYGNILLSYAMEDGNYLELPQLQRGVIWGIGRLAGARPGTVRPSSVEIRPYLRSPDTEVRGLSAWLAGLLRIENAVDDLRDLVDDRGGFSFYQDWELHKKSVLETSLEALRRISDPSV